MNQTNVSSSAAAVRPPAASALASARVKGAHVRAFLIWYTAQGGQERSARLLEHVAPEHRPLFDAACPDLGVLDATWYPATAIHGILDGVLNGLTMAEEEALARQAATVMMQTTLRGVYRWLFEKMMTPERYMRNVQVLFSRYHDTGVITKIEVTPNTHMTVVRDWAGHHRYICELLFQASIVTYEAMGCREVVGNRLKCVSAGASECAYTITWKDR